MRYHLRSTKDLNIEMCGLDFIGGFFYIRSIMFLKNDLDIEKLVAAFRVVVERYPRMTGTVVCDAGKNFIRSGPGFDLEIVELDEPCPAATRLDLVPVVGAVHGEPIAKVKVVKFNDGMWSMSHAFAHVFGDAAVSKFWITDLFKLYLGESVSPAIEEVAAPEFEDVDAPSELFGVNDWEPVPIEDTERFGIFIGSEAVAGITKRARAERLNAVDVVRAIIVKAFSESVGDKVSIQTLYNARYVSGVDIPRGYHGNSNLRWKFYIDASNESVIELARRIRSIPKPTAETTKRDLGWVNSQYKRHGHGAYGFVPGTVQAPDRSTLMLNVSVVHGSDASPFTTYRDMFIVEPYKHLANFISIINVRDTDGRTAMSIHLILDTKIIEQFKVRFDELLGAHSPD